MDNSSGPRSTTAQAPDYEQEARQLRKQRFNKMINDIAPNKDFFFSFVQHPSMHTPEGIRALATEIYKYKRNAKECEEKSVDSALQGLSHGRT